jgi:hypothetical protein
LEEESGKPAAIAVTFTLDKDKAVDPQDNQQWIWAAGKMQYIRPTKEEIKDTPADGDMVMKRIYRSSDINPKYLQAIGIETIPNKTTLRCSIIPFFFRTSPTDDRMDFLCDIKHQKPSPVYSFQLTKLNTPEEIYWSNKICKQQVVNEILAELRNIITNYNNKHNPFTAWDKVDWTYFWSAEDSKNSRCYLLPMMNVGHTDIVFKNTRSYIWKKLPEEVQWLIKTTPQAKI